MSLPPVGFLPGPCYSPYTETHDGYCVQLNGGSACGEYHYGNGVTGCETLPDCTPQGSWTPYYAWHGRCLWWNELIGAVAPPSGGGGSNGPPAEGGGGGPGGGPGGSGTVYCAAGFYSPDGVNCVPIVNTPGGGGSVPPDPIPQTEERDYTPLYWAGGIGAAAIIGGILFSIGRKK